jgi:hypothetical protein
VRLTLVILGNAIAENLFYFGVVMFFLAPVFASCKRKVLAAMCCGLAAVVIAACLAFLGCSIDFQIR